MDLDAFRALRTPDGQALLAAMPPYDETTAIVVAERLRRAHPPGLVAAALTQTRLRRRARAKFGDAADRMYFTAEGLEQSTRASVAALRAERLAASGARRVADLCCGIGADALAFAAAGLHVLAVDRDPLTCAVTAANAAALGVADRVDVCCADVTEVALDGCDAAYVDPARRSARGRTFDPDAYSPPWSFVLALAERVPATVAKVAPGVPHDLVPGRAEAQWVSDAGDVKEAALWFGPLATAARRATLLPGRHTVASANATVASAPVGPVRRWLYEPDGAVIRAGLVAEVADALHGSLLDGSIAYVAADTLAGSPFATPYEVTDVLPFNLKQLRRRLLDSGVGRVVVKKRGSAVEPDELRRRLRLPGGGAERVVFVTRVAGAPTALLALRPPAQLD